MHDQTPVIHIAENYTWRIAAYCVGVESRLSLRPIAESSQKWKLAPIRKPTRHELLFHARSVHQ
jgi:hypothetical protein